LPIAAENIRVFSQIFLKKCAPAGHFTPSGCIMVVILQQCKKQTTKSTPEALNESAEAGN
jgi:hypothetical protein